MKIRRKRKKGDIAKEVWAMIDLNSKLLYSRLVFGRIGLHFCKTRKTLKISIRTGNNK